MSFSKYPDSLDDSSSLPPSTDLVTPVKAEVTNRLRDAILALEGELGVQPSSTYSTVRTRLDFIESNLYSVTVSSNDTNPDDLEFKIVAGNNITINKLNVGGNEQLEISSTASGGGGAALSSDDKNQSPTATSGNNQSTGITISDNPVGYVGVLINGIFYTVGDGVLSNDCYFSDDGGSTAKQINDIVSGDELFWNGLISGFDLESSDRVDIIYEAGSSQPDSFQKLIIPLAINASVNGNVFTVIGGDEFNPNDYDFSGLKITFVARIATTNASNPARIRLFNVTDGSLVTQFSTPSLDIVRQTIELTVPSDFPNSQKTYDVQLATTSPGDTAICQKCELILTLDN